MEPLGRARPRGLHERCLKDRRNSRRHYSAFNTTYRQKTYRSRDQDSNLGKMCLLFAIILVMAILCQNKPINGAEDQQQNGQQAPAPTPATNEQTSTTASVDSSDANEKNEKYIISGWTHVTKHWPRGEVAYYTASERRHHFIDTRLPKEVAARGAKVNVTIEFYYHHKNIEPVLSFVPCSNKHDMRSNGNSFEKHKWNVFSQTIDTSNCKERNDVTVDVLLHDKGDIFAWKFISLEELNPNNNADQPEPKIEKRSDDNNSNEQSGDNQNNNDQDQNNQQNNSDNQNNHENKDQNSNQHENENQNPNQNNHQAQGEGSGHGDNENKDQNNNQHESENHDANGNQNPNQNNHQAQGGSSSHGDNENKDQNNNQHVNENQNNGQHNGKQPSQPINLFKIRCDPKNCDKKKFELKRFRPMVNGLPILQNSLLKDNTYLINDGDKPLRIKLITKDNLATRDICLDANIYMEEGTKLLFGYPHSTKEHTKNTGTSAASQQQREASSNSASTVAESKNSANDKAEPQPTAAKFESSPPNDDDKSSPDTVKQADSDAQANQISTQATQKTSTDAKNQANIRLITEITPPKTPQPQWTRRKICVSDHLPRLDLGDESADKELLLEPKVGPNNIIGIQFHPESGVSFSKQLTTLSFMPNLNSISESDLQEYWKAKGGELLLYDAGVSGSQSASGNKQLNVTNIAPGQDSFDLVSRWLKLSNDQANNVTFNLNTKNEDWIKTVGIDVQKAGLNWSLHDVYPNPKDLDTKKDDINLKVAVEGLKDEEFRVKIRYNLTDEAKKSDGNHSLTIKSMAIGDPCIDKDYCQNEGVCKAIGTSQAQCDCPQGYSGEKCEHINPCEVLYDGRAGKFICESIKAKCVEKIPVLRCVWENDEYFECRLKGPTESPLQDDKELTSDQMKLKIAEQSKLIIIMGALMAALSLFAIVIIGNLVMRLLGAKKRVKSAEEAREMSSRLGDRRTAGVPKYGRPAAASFQNQAFDD